MITDENFAEIGEHAVLKAHKGPGNGKGLTRRRTCSFPGFAFLVIFSVFYVFVFAFLVFLGFFLFLVFWCLFFFSRVLKQIQA